MISAGPPGLRLRGVEACQESLMELPRLTCLRLLQGAALIVAVAMTPPAWTKPGTVNSLDTIVNDMKLRNDLVLRGYESKTVGWYVGPGYVMMGNQARTSNTPQWFKNAYPNLINDNPLRAFLPWIVLFDGAGHAATNTRVHFRNLKAFYKSKRTGQWVSWGSTPGVSGYATPKEGLFGGSVPQDRR